MFCDSAVCVHIARRGGAAAGGAASSEWLDERSRALDWLAMRGASSAAAELVLVRVAETIDEGDELLAAMTKDPVTRAALAQQHFAVPTQ